jgi:type 1 fimbria pilin
MKMVKKLKGLTLLALFAILVASAAAANAMAGDCPGSGQNCKQTSDGTVYFKGLDQEE